MVISHRSGETDDSGIAHMGVAWGCSLIKAGVTGGERLAKLNELIRIEDAGSKPLRWRRSRHPWLRSEPNPGSCHDPQALVRNHRCLY